MSTDVNIAHVAWTIKDNTCKDNSLSISLYHFCLEQAIKRKAKIFSLGTTSRKSLATFKEQLNAERGILLKVQVRHRKRIMLSDFRIIPFHRNKISLTIMKLMLSITLYISGRRGYELVSKEIWKRFD